MIICNTKNCLILGSWSTTTPWSTIISKIRNTCIGYSNILFGTNCGTITHLTNWCDMIIRIITSSKSTIIGNNRYYSGNYTRCTISII